MTQSLLQKYIELDGNTISLEKLIVDYIESVGDLKSGCENPDNILLNFAEYDDNGTQKRRLTVSPIAEYFYIWANGQRYEKQSEYIDITDDKGPHFIYYNEEGILSELLEPWEIELPVAPVCIIYWTGDEYIPPFYEKHNVRTILGRLEHAYKHKTIKTRYEYGYDVSIDPAAQFFSFSVGSIWDEDINHIHPETIQARKWYKDIDNAGLTFICTQLDGIPVIKSLSNILQYDDPVLGLQDVNNSSHIAMFSFATNSKDEPIMFLTGQRQDVTIANARLNNTPESLDATGFISPEYKLLFRHIFKRNGTSVQYIESFDYRNVSTVIGSNAINQNVPSSRILFSDGDKLISKTTDGPGIGEEISCTPFARSILDDADAATVKQTIGLNNVSNDAQLKIASNLSDVNSASTALNNINGLARSYNHQTNTPSNTTRTKLRIDTGVCRLAYSSADTLTNNVSFASAFKTGSIPIIIPCKSYNTQNGLTVSELKDGSARAVSITESGFAFSYSLSSANFSAGDYIDLQWIAIGEET